MKYLSSLPVITYEKKAASTNYSTAAVAPTTIRKLSSVRIIMARAPYKIVSFLNDIIYEVLREVGIEDWGTDMFELDETRTQLDDVVKSIIRASEKVSDGVCLYSYLYEFRKYRDVIVSSTYEDTQSKEESSIKYEMLIWTF